MAKPKTNADGKVLLSEERYDKLLAAGKRGGRAAVRHLRGDKWGLGGILAGALVAYAANMKSITDLQFVKDHWWAKGIAILLLGLVIRRKGGKWAKYGSVIMAAGAAVLVRDYQDDDAKKNGTTKGVEDNDTGDAQQGGQWMTMADGLTQVWVAADALKNAPTAPALGSANAGGMGDVATRIADRVYAAAA